MTEEQKELLHRAANRAAMIASTPGNTIAVSTLMLGQEVGAIAQVLLEQHRLEGKPE